ncbi:5-methyltetrahydropteroyltriglutamate--homocysteine methyltransferase [Bradyrhizobium sp. GM2.4]
MQRTKAPFRADEVGSLLRPAKIKEARARLEKGEISADDLRKIEDLEIEKVVHKQASLGLKLATDGEFRRSWWHFDFLAKLTGCEMFHPDTGIQFAGVETRHDAVRVIGKLDFPDDHPMLDHFRFLKKVADQAHVTAKMTIPSPAVLHFRGGRKAISKDVYPDLDAFYEDLGKTYRKAVKAFYDAGCRYLQFDDTVWAYLCSPDELQKARERGDNPEGLQQIYARVINYALAEKPADMVVTTHVCRGNFRSTWISSGGYEPVAETMLAGTNYDGYFLEYDSDRAGGFEPLRFLPKGNKVVVVGVITSKFGELENKDAHQAPSRGSRQVRPAGAARALPAMRLCLNRGRQHPLGGGAVGQAQPRRGDREGSVGPIRLHSFTVIPREGEESSTPRLLGESLTSRRTGSPGQTGR